MTQVNESRSHEVFITGLRNAHAMEKQALAIMKPQVGRIENYPEVRERLERHIAETEGQVERLEGLLARLDSHPSGVKDAALSVMGTMATLGHTPAPDEILKNSFANFAFENYEIAAYNSLIAMGEASGHAEALPLLQQNLSEEEEMASWLEENLPLVTDRYMGLSEAGEQAKR